MFKDCFKIFELNDDLHGGNKSCDLSKIHLECPRRPPADKHFN